MPSFVLLPVGQLSPPSSPPLVGPLHVPATSCCPSRIVPARRLPVPIRARQPAAATSTEDYGHATTAWLGPATASRKWGLCCLHTPRKPKKKFEAPQEARARGNSAAAPHLPLPPSTTTPRSAPTLPLQFAVCVSERYSVVRTLPDLSIQVKVGRYEVLSMLNPPRLPTFLTLPYGSRSCPVNSPSTPTPTLIHTKPYLPCLGALFCTASTPFPFHPFRNFPLTSISFLSPQGGLSISSPSHPLLPFFDPSKPSLNPDVCHHNHSYNHQHQTPPT
ncbi:hypothetical protein BDP81DRAFT_206503 [Colletotrichum phormii]|uniref:Uncharacterized protein n=1 Tax=Colletotrichum phormii TaxID=359342 RepID=A0AAJ0EIW3_9PEZI|nr:uncharacterized protein BDP81DRAFT_206503 [Colletotrichum phormii]KAK1638335.1 hypothetical protein BDP81DRAFT_206503 [Colletotrichum phormii]